MEKVIDSCMDVNIENISKLPNTLTMPEINLGKGKQFSYDKKIACHKVIEKVAKLIPQKIAIVHNGYEISYKLLNQKANQLAHFLVQAGFKKNSIIGIYLEPSVETVISILAILKIGGCYLPLEVAYPIERLNYMLADSNAKAIITTKNLSKNIRKLKELKHIYIDELKVHLKLQKLTNLNKSVSSKSNAYVIYTSGSTGRPKGVQIHHQAINNHMTWMIDHFELNENEKILFKTPFSFDPSVWEILLPLYLGAKLIIAPKGSHLDPHLLNQTIIKNKVTVIQLVPSLLDKFLKLENAKLCSSLKHVFCGGESLLSYTKEQFFKIFSCKLHNLYGPTEATIDITSHTVTNTPTEIKRNIIGKPIYNTHLYVFNKNLQPCAINEEGELYIQSDSLSKGYINQPSLTREKFIDNPLKISKHKLYKTGDIVKWLPQGFLEYIGRDGEQIKINGVRIELNEISYRVLLHKEISNCVLVKEKDQYSNFYIACYLVKNSKYKLNLSKIKNDLKSFFPSYMLPKKYSVIENIPLTVNGKVDYIKLQNIADKNNLSKAKSKPCNEILSGQEKRLLLIWKEVLQVENISIHDDFFDLGGHSLLALQLLEQIQKEFSLLLSVSSIFSASSIQQQSKLISSLLGKKSITASAMTNLLSINPVVTLASSGKKTPLFLIHPVGGTVFWYTLLAKALGNDRAIYGIQDPGIELKRKLFPTIKDMAKYYASVIQKIQPKGSYIIGGASFGATVAIEVCNILREQGETIDFIPVFDGWGIYPETLRDDNYFKESMQRQQNDLSTKFAAYGITESKNLLNLQKQRLNLLWKYKLNDVNHQIVLYKAREILPVFMPIDDKFNHWKKFTHIKIKKYIVPGNHETMFQRPNIEFLADSVVKSLEEFSE